jgi:hypothetical protein
MTVMDGLTGETAAKVLYTAGVLTIVNRGILEINEEGLTPITLTNVEM